MTRLKKWPALNLRENSTHKSQMIIGFQCTIVKRRLFKKFNDDWMLTQSRVTSRPSNNNGMQKGCEGLAVMGSKEAQQDMQSRQTGSRLGIPSEGKGMIVP